MKPSEDARRAAGERSLTWGLGLALIGALLSGPVALGLVSLLHPQPPWRGAVEFAASYHPIQLLPYLLGLLLVSGLLIVIASLHRLAAPAQKARTAVAQLFTAAFGALIFLNYVIQTTFVPTLVRPLESQNAPLVSALTMSNPASLAWGLEMWGYGLWGVAGWLCAPVLAKPGRLWQLSAWGFRINGPVSMIGALATTWDRSWLLSAVGLVAFALWNLLVVAMCALPLLAARQERRSGPPTALPRPRARAHQPASS